MSSNRYPDYPSSAVALEESVLALWREEDLFRQTLKATEGAPEFVFYEGPPTANGRPGIHHVISRTIKDLFCRYQTMRGNHVTRIAGWDTHGLPVEIEAEKKLGISGKREIEAIGVARFNEVCRDSVFTYKEEWERFSERIGYWLDYSRPYVTYTPEYIESVWWILKQFAERGLLYRGHKSVAYCPRCGTALSSHEVAQGYEDVLDPSLYFIAPLVDEEGHLDDDDRAILVWTTTPWTLPSNAALAVRPDLVYVEVPWEGWRLLVAEERVESLFGADVETGRRYAAAELIGMKYRRPFDLVAADDPGSSAWHVVGEDFVSAEDGTGVVHLAPAFGSDDYAAGQRHNLPMMQPLDEAGRFTADVPLVGGMFVKDADQLLVEDLRSRDLLFRHSMESHSYPHCWRCSSPLLYIARETWYIRTTSVKEAMLANNAQVGWHPPEIGTGRFGEWLEGNVDWALSRDRYWGTPLPVWICDKDSRHVEFIGSLAELDVRTGGLPDGFDPHKPFIDDVTWKCLECDGAMHRTPEVIDVWFDSGAMPYAQWHYPFENEDRFRAHFPADFICEGVDQTRGWFYSLMAIATMLEHGPAFRSVVVNDQLLDKDGLKMSKSRGNVVDPWVAISEYGADAIRWYLLTVSQPWVSKRFDADALADSARRAFDRLANTYRFFALYANLEQWEPGAADPSPADRPVMDRWILARLDRLIREVSTDMDDFEATRAARAIGDFLTDDVSNWYVRRSRARFWGTSAEGDAAGADARAAFRTLNDVLVTVARLLAPLTPFQADWLHRALTGDSVHLARYPEPSSALRDDALETGMDAIREMVRLGRAARERMKTGVRQPLRALHAVVPGSIQLSDALLEVLREELNVKEVRFLEAAESLVSLHAVPNFRALGKRFGPRTPQVAEAVRALSTESLEAFRRGEALRVFLEGEDFALEAEELDVREEAAGELVVESGAGFAVGLDPRIDDALRREGLARELVNRIQRCRKDQGLDVSDRITLHVSAADEVLVAAAQEHAAYIAAETLAVEFTAGAGAASTGMAVDVDGLEARIAIQRVGA